jgi:drug/metabolite transporter (DMT)-like permease
VGLPGGDRLHAPTIAGMAVGLAGAALLFTPDAGTGAIDHKLAIGFLLLSIGMAGWSFGSIIQRRKAGKARSHVRSRRTGHQSAPRSQRRSGRHSSKLSRS